LGWLLSQSINSFVKKLPHAVRSQPDKDGHGQLASGLAIDFTVSPAPDLFQALAPRTNSQKYRCREFIHREGKSASFTSPLCKPSRTVFPADAQVCFAASPPLHAGHSLISASGPSAEIALSAWNTAQRLA
jgi:hypothetical protein